MELVSTVQVQHQLRILCDTAAAAACLQFRLQNHQSREKGRTLAAKFANLEALQWLHLGHCGSERFVCQVAAAFGHWHILCWARSQHRRIHGTKWCVQWLL